MDAAPVIHPPRPDMPRHLPNPAFVGALLLCACVPAVRSADVDRDFYTERRSYSSGEDVRLVLRNDSREPIGFNLCFVVLEREMGGRWGHAEHQADRACPAVLHGLTPGAEARDTYPLPERLPSGRYRLSSEVEVTGSGARFPITTNPFQVEGKI